MDRDGEPLSNDCPVQAAKKLLDNFENSMADSKADVELGI